MNRRRTLPLRAAALIPAAMIVTAAHADTYHGQANRGQPCSDCHTEHYEEGGGLPAGTDTGGPFDELLVRSTTNRLCLFCHDGSDVTAPDVLAPVTSYSGSGDEHSAAGFFSGAVGTKNDNGHDLGVLVTEVPFSTLTNVTLTCASCHDPHGTANFRNLLDRPAGTVDAAVKVGTDVFVRSLPGDPPSMGATLQAYRESNVGYRSSTSRWCTTCHDQLQPMLNNPANRDHHFTDVSIDGAGYPTDPPHWASGTGSGFGSATGDGVEGVPRLRFQVAGAVDVTSAQLAAADNQVMCETCHLAHGGDYEHGFVWPEEGAGSTADKDSGCQQCHNY
jgi:hypothetical protein